MLANGVPGLVTACCSAGRNQRIHGFPEKGKRKSCYIVVTIVAPVLNPSGEIFNTLSYRLFILFFSLSLISVVVAGSEVAVLSNGRR